LFSMFGSHAHLAPRDLLSRTSISCMLEKHPWSHWGRRQSNLDNTVSEIPNIQDPGSKCHAPVKSYVHDMYSSRSAPTATMQSSTLIQEEASQRERQAPTRSRHPREACVRQRTPITSMK